MEIIMERTCGRGGLYGEVLSLHSGLQIEPLNKKERGNNELALGCHRFIFRHNNQSIVGVSNGRDDGWAARSGRSVWGGLVSLFGATNQSTKKYKNKIEHGHSWPPG
jgi:hypothetical protein